MGVGFLLGCIGIGKIQCSIDLSSQYQIKNQRLRVQKIIQNILRTKISNVSPGASVSRMEVSSASLGARDPYQQLNFIDPSYQLSCRSQVVSRGFQHLPLFLCSCDASGAGLACLGTPLGWWTSVTRVGHSLQVGPLVDLLACVDRYDSFQVNSLYQYFSSCFCPQFIVQLPGSSFVFMLDGGLFLSYIAVQALLYLLHAKPCFSFLSLASKLQYTISPSLSTSHYGTQCLVCLCLSSLLRILPCLTFPHFGVREIEEVTNHVLLKFLFQN